MWKLSTYNPWFQQADLLCYPRITIVMKNKYFRSSMSLDFKYFFGLVFMILFCTFDQRSQNAENFNKIWLPIFINVFFFIIWIFELFRFCPKMKKLFLKSLYTYGLIRVLKYSKYNTWNIKNTYQSVSI